MAQIAIQQIPLSTAGLAVSPVAAAGGGDQFANDGRTYYQVVNGGGGAITVTFNSQTQCNQGFDHDIALSVGAGETRLIGPFPTYRFNDASGNVLVTYSGVTSVTVAAVRL